eukprot:640347-Amphidinium_carterae.5
MGCWGRKAERGMKVASMRRYPVHSKCHRAAKSALRKAVPARENSCLTDIAYFRCGARTHASKKNAATKQQKEEQTTITNGGRGQTSREAMQLLPFSLKGSLTPALN